MNTETKKMTKHYTNEEKTGLSKAENDRKEYLFKLMNWGKQKITRYDLHVLIPVNRFKFSDIIRKFLNEEILIQNPTSHLIHTGLYETPIIMPNNNTRYFIDLDRVKEEWTELCIKRDTFKLRGKTDTHTLESFINSTNLNS